MSPNRLSIQGQLMSVSGKQATPSNRVVKGLAQIHYKKYCHPAAADTLVYSMLRGFHPSQAINWQLSSLIV